MVYWDERRGVGRITACTFAHWKAVASQLGSAEDALMARFAYCILLLTTRTNNESITITEHA